MNIGKITKKAVKIGKAALPYLPVFLELFGAVKKAAKKAPSAV